MATHFGKGHLITLSVSDRSIGRERIAYIDMSDSGQAGGALVNLRGFIMGRNSLKVNEVRPGSKTFRLGLLVVY
jgi:hypothetical protein